MAEKSQAQYFRDQEAEQKRLDRRAVRDSIAELIKEMRAKHAGHEAYMTERLEKVLTIVEKFVDDV